MKRPVLKRLVPETAGFNRRRIAAAAAVLIITLGAITYLLTQAPGDAIVRTEPVITATAGRPPRELLEDLPEASKLPIPIPEPGLGVFGRRSKATPPPAVGPQVSPRVQRAFSEKISYSRRQPPPSSSPRPRPAVPAVTAELSSIFEDLERQNQALGRFLEKPAHSDPAELLAQRLAQQAPASPRLEPPRLEPPRLEPPPTQHQPVRAEQPVSPLVLRQGTVIPAQLLSEINSDLPGQVLAHIVTDVRDSLSFSTLLLPRGTKILGAYSTGLTAGQNRLAVAWTRLLLPDGRSIDVADLPAVDARGRSGLSDRVNHHTARIFGNALLLSLLSAGFQAAQPSSGELRISAGELAVQGASRELERAATELLRRGASIPPTVTIRAGTVFNVFLTGDLTFAAPYRP